MDTVKSTLAGAKDRDYWWTVVAVDPIAVPLTRVLADRERPSADQVTWASIAVAVPVGFAYASGSRLGLVLGAILFYCAFVLDCVDGKLARVRGVTSPRGKVLDEMADAARRVSASIGLAAYLWWRGPRGAFWWAIAYLVVASFFAQISGGTRSEPSSPAGGRWSQALAAHRLLPSPGTPDVGAAVFIFGPLTGLVVPALAVGVMALSLAVLVTLRRRLRRATTR
jgi:phosphatidylglycerophosphate synthase